MAIEVLALELDDLTPLLELLTELLLCFELDETTIPLELDVFTELLLFAELDVFGVLLELDLGTLLELLSGFFVYFAVIAIFSITDTSFPAVPIFFSQM